MPILDALSFDRGFHFNSIDKSGTPARDTTYKVDGLASLRFDTTSSGAHLEWVRHDFKRTHPQQPSVAMYVWPRSWFSYGSDYYPRIYFTMGSGSHKLDLRWNTYTHTHDLYINGALAEAGTIEVAQNDFFQLQMWANIDPVSGFVKVKVDGHLSIDYAGDTQPSGALAYADFCYVQAGKYALAGNEKAHIDNWVLGYGEFLGDCHVDEILPDSDSVVQFTPITGSDNYAMLNEIYPINEDTYVYTQTDGHADDIGLEAWDNTTPNGITKNPEAVIPWVWSRVTTATGEHLRVGIKSNGVVSDEQFAQFMAHRRYAHTTLLDPDGDVPWTKTAIDAVLLRYEADLTA